MNTGKMNELINIEEHIAYKDFKISDAASKLENLKLNPVLFLVNENKEFVGSITDGDIRRALIKGVKIDSSISEIVQGNPIFIKKDEINVNKIKEWRNSNFKVIPILDKKNRIVDLLNFRLEKNYLPIDCIIMAGGKGERLRPLTESIPKPLLPIDGKPIIEYIIDHFRSFGVSDFLITTNYLASKINEFTEIKKSNSLKITCFKEPEYMGTIGAISLIKKINNGVVLISNSDLITNLNLEDFYLAFQESNSDCSILSISHKIEIPYGVMKLKSNELISITEKPTYSYETNGGIYLVKTSLLNLIPKNKPFTAIEFLEKLIEYKKKITTYNHVGYWKDIGNHTDYNQAKIDLKFITQNE